MYSRDIEDTGWPGLLYLFGQNSSTRQFSYCFIQLGGHKELEHIPTDIR